MEKNYDQGGQRVTSCCGCYSTYCDTTLCCKACYNEVDIGEGDGSEFLPSMTEVDIDLYYKNVFSTIEREAEARAFLASP
jgi:hypothetical protein